MNRGLLATSKPLYFGDPTNGTNDCFENNDVNDAQQNDDDAPPRSGMRHVVDCSELKQSNELSAPDPGPSNS
ncbi:MAG: hypothetical protein ACI97A_000661 [Planctomycetota bacterium]|jgi:hypothetical protein